VRTVYLGFQNIKCLKLRRYVNDHTVLKTFAVLAPGSQSGNFWIHPRMSHVTVKHRQWSFLLTGTRAAHT